MGTGKMAIFSNHMIKKKLYKERLDKKKKVFLHLLSAAINL